MLKMDPVGCQLNQKPSEPHPYLSCSHNMLHACITQRRPHNNNPCQLTGLLYHRGCVRDTQLLPCSAAMPHLQISP